MSLCLSVCGLYFKLSFVFWLKYGWNTLKMKTLDCWPYIYLILCVLVQMTGDMILLLLLFPGIRHLDIDPCYDNCGLLGTCHASFCGGSLCAIIKQIRHFLEEHRHDVITVNFNHEIKDEVKVFKALTRQIKVFIRWRFWSLLATYISIQIYANEFYPFIITTVTT